MRQKAFFPSLPPTGWVAGGAGRAAHAQPAFERHWQRLLGRKLLPSCKMVDWTVLQAHCSCSACVLWDRGCGKRARRKCEGGPTSGGSGGTAGAAGRGLHALCAAPRRRQRRLSAGGGLQARAGAATVRPFHLISAGASPGHAASQDEQGRLVSSGQAAPPPRAGIGAAWAPLGALGWWLLSPVTCGGAT